MAGISTSSVQAAAAAAQVGAAPNRSLQTPRARGLRERLIEAPLFAAAFVTILTTAGIVAVLLVETLSFFRVVPLRMFLTDTQWTPLFSDKHYGIIVLLSATMLTSVGAMFVALPLGLLAAIFLSEYASPRVHRVIKPVLEILAGIPTVVYGYFALLFVTPALQRMIPQTAVFNGLSASIVMGFMILPLVSSMSEDAMAAVPRSLREGGYSLGATRFEVATRIVVPSALSGIVAAFILAISRAVGETMIVAIAAGQSPTLALSPLVPMETWTAYSVQVRVGVTPHGAGADQRSLAVGSTLFLMTLLLNIISQRVLRRFREEYQ